MEQRRDKGMSIGSVVAAAIFAIAVIISLGLLWHPGGELAPSRTASDAITPKAQVTPDVSGDTRTLERPAPPATTGADPTQQSQR